MYRLYIGNKNYSSWSLRPWVLMRALEIPFEEEQVVFADGSNWAAFRRFAPNGRVPCLHDGGRVVWDSLAITEYLAERHDGVWPAADDARAWARCVASEMHSGFSALRNGCSMSCGQRVELRQIGDALAADVRRIDEIWSEGPQRFDGPWLAGPDFTAADAFYAPVAFRVQTYGLPLSQPAAAYGDRLLGHPAMAEWCQAALAEPWRDAAHEDEITQAGTVTADYRSV